MQLISLQLQDLRSYRKASIEFAPGVNAIVGDNGAGKSTVLAAIGLALFNTRPPSATNDELVREGAKTAEIVVDFVSALDERRYQVVRRFGGSNQYRVLDPDRGHQLLVEGVADCESWLRQHLGVGPDTSLSDLFQHTIGVYQGTFTAPFLLTPAVRKPIFDPLLRVDEYPKAALALQAPRRELGDQDHVAQVRLAEIGGRLQVLAGLREQMAEVRARLHDNEGALAKAREALQAAEQHCQAYANLRAAVTVAEREQARLAAEVNTQKAKLDAAQAALDSAQRAAERCRAALPGYEHYMGADRDRTALDAMRQQRDGVKSSIARLERREGVGQAHEQDMRRQLAVLAEQAQLAAELEPLAAQQKELEDALHKAQQAVIEIKAARQRVSDAEQRWQKQQTLVARLSTEVAEREQLQIRLDELQQTISDEQHKLEQRQAQGGQYQARQQQLDKQLAELAEAEGGTCPVCEQPLTPEHRAELERSVQAELVALRAQVYALAGEQETARERRAALQREQQAGVRQLTNLAGPGQLQDAIATQEALVTELTRACAQVVALGDPDAEVTRLTEALQALGNPRQKLAICRADLAKRPGLEADLAATLRDLQAIDDDLAAQEKALAPFATLNERLAAVEQKLREHAEAYRTYLGNQQEAARLGEREEQVSGAFAALEALTARLTEANASLQAAQADYDGEADQRAQEERRRWGEKMAGLEATIKGDHDLLAQLERQLAALEALLGEQAALQATRAKIARAMRLIDWTRDLLRAAGPYVTRQLVRSISLEAAGLYSELMDNYAVRLQWSEDYELSLEVNGLQRGYAQLSGGEQMCAALALRLALLRHLTGIDIAFFDEPTAHLDGERRALLAHTLTHVQGFGQIFVISHDSTFEQAAQAYYVVTKDGDGSHIERL